MIDGCYGPESEMSTPDLFDSWNTYEKVVANDYMHHRDFFVALVQEVKARDLAPLSVADLGCGDCAPILDLLRCFEVHDYLGIDQSESALRRARARLLPVGLNFDLRQGEILHELRELTDQYNLIVCSYSLHHLDVKEKQDVLKECRRCLVPGGLLAVIDVFLEPGESIGSYLERWTTNAQSRYAALDAEEIEDLLAHVRSSDFPETVSTYRRLSTAAGFSRVSRIAQDAERLNQFVLFY